MAGLRVFGIILRGAVIGAGLGESFRVLPLGTGSRDWKLDGSRDSAHCLVLFQIVSGIIHHTLAPKLLKRLFLFSYAAAVQSSTGKCLLGFGL